MNYVNSCLCCQISNLVLDIWSSFVRKLLTNSLQIKYNFSNTTTFEHLAVIKVKYNSLRLCDIARTMFDTELFLCYNLCTNNCLNVLHFYIFYLKVKLLELEYF